KLHSVSYPIINSLKTQLTIAASLGKRHGEAFYCSGLIESLKLMGGKAQINILAPLPDQFQEDPPEVPIADNRTMAQLLQTPTEGYEDAIVIPEIAANNFELKHGLINLFQNKQFFGHDKEDSHAHIRYFDKITSTMRVPNVPSSLIKLMLFPFSLEGAAQIWLKKEPPRSILTWDDLISKFINQFFPPSKTTNLRNKITRFQQRFDESFNEAWDRFNDLLRACPHHGFSELHQLDTFYNALNVKDQDSLNSTAGGNFLDKMPSECLKIIMSKSKVRQSRAKAVVAKVNTSSSTPAISSDVAELKDMVRALLLDKKNQSSALAPSLTPAPVKAVELNCVTCSGTHSYQNCPATCGNVYRDNIQERDNERRRDQANGQIEKFYKIFKDMSFEISFTDALTLMPKFASTLKALIGNKEKLSEMARTPMNEHCSAVILNKLPIKLGDPGKFLIPCEFPGMDECLASSDLGASINLMPLFVWEGLSLPKLTPTCMTLELADRSVFKSIGIAKDVSVKVGVFHFPADFVVVDFEPDPRVPLILGRCFLKTGRALIDVHKGELILRIRNEAITYNLDQTSRYSANYNQMTTNKIDVIDMACEEYSQEVLGFSDVTASGNPTTYDDLIVSTTSPTLTSFGDSDFLLFEEADAFLSLEDDPNSPEFNPFYYDPKGDILLLEAILNSEPLPPLPNHEQYMPSFKKELKVCEAKMVKSFVDEPPEEKSALIKVLKSHKRAIAWKLSDIQGINPEFCTYKILMEEDYKPAVQHQRRVNPKIYDVIKKEVEKLLDAGLIYPIYDSPWVSPVHRVPNKGGFTVVENEENELIPTCLVTRWRVCIDYRKLNEATCKDHFPLLFMDQMLERLAGNEYYCFLDVLGFSDVTASGNPTPYDDPIVSTTSPTLTLFGDSDFLLFEEADAFLGLEDDPNSLKFNPFYYDPEGDILLLEAILNSKPLPPLPNNEQYMPSFKKELKVCEAKTVKSFVDEPPEVELKDLPPHLEYVFLEGDNKLPVIISKELGDEEKSTLIKDYKPAVQHQRRVNPKIHDVIKKEVEKLLDAGLIYPISDCPWVSPVHCVPKKGGFTVVENEENELIPTRLVIGRRVCIDYQKLNEATHKDRFPLPFMDQMLERLAGNEYYCFLDGFSGYFQIPIDPRDQEKTTFTCPYGTFAYRRMPFSLCNAPGTFQRCMLAIFHDMVEKTMEVFMDDFSVLGNSFENCLSRLDKMLQRCEDTNLCLNWEKSHFMVKEGIVLGHKFLRMRLRLTRPKSMSLLNYLIPQLSKVSLCQKDAKARLLWWVLLLQEFDFKVLDTKGAENLEADHLSQLENPYENMLDPKEINETFPLETLSMVNFYGDSSGPWFADFANYHAGYFIVKDLCGSSDPVVCARQRSSRHFRSLPQRTHGQHGANLTAKKQANFDLAIAGDHWKVQLNELNELRDHAYENSLFNKEKTKRIHGSKIKNRIFNVVELSQANRPNFKVNGHRLKHYFGGDVPQLVVLDLQTSPWTNEFRELGQAQRH
nr:reverse transcriptase domain-containing protein [Tanacetum cinerariifolium]